MVLILATLVTLAAVVPLAVLASRADDPKPVPDIARGLFVMDGSSGGEPLPLSGATITKVDHATIRVEIVGTTAAAWALFEAEGDQVASSSATGPAPLALAVPLSALEPGVYDLLVSTTIQDASVVERAARFEIGDAR